MAKKIVHEGTRSWWSGKYRTLCGLTFRKSRSAWWSSVNCSACKRAQKSGR